MFFSMWSLVDCGRMNAVLSWDCPECFFVFQREQEIMDGSDGYGR